MGYKCGNCNIEFGNKRDFVEHMLDAHNSPFIEGDFSDISDKIIAQRIADVSHPKKGQSEVQQEKVKKSRGD